MKPVKALGLGLEFKMATLLQMQSTGAGVGFEVEVVGF